MATLAVSGAQEGRVACVHTLVLFNICDSYIRRNEGQERVIGALLGCVNADGVVEIKNSYAVPADERGGQIAIDIDYHRQMLELNMRCTPKDVLVGWYSTGSLIVATDAPLHEFFARECSHPVHLAVDTSLLEPGKAVRAWVGSAVSLKEAVVGTSFTPIAVTYAFADAEKAGLPLLTTTTPEPLPSDVAGLTGALGRLQALLQLGADYAQAVVDGKVAPDPSLGRLLAEAVAAVPRMAPGAMSGLFNDAVQDVLLVMYLSNLTRTQLQLSDSLHMPIQGL